MIAPSPITKVVRISIHVEKLVTNDDEKYDFSIRKFLDN